MYENIYILIALTTAKVSNASIYKAFSKKDKKNTLGDQSYPKRGFVLLIIVARTFLYFFCFFCFVICSLRKTGRLLLVCFYQWYPLPSEINSILALLQRAICVSNLCPYARLNKRFKIWHTETLIQTFLNFFFSRMLYGLIKKW